LLVLNLLVQSIFVAITATVLARPTFSEQDLAGLMTWRINVGQSVKYYDKLTFTSLSERICLQSPDYPVEMSSGISGTLGMITSYYPALTDENMSYANFLIGGPTLTLLAMMCWCLTTMAEFQSVWRLFEAVACLPTSRHTQVLKSGEEDFVIASMSVSRKAFFMFVLLCRFAIVTVLWYSGCIYLVNYSIDAGDLILNAVALEVILNVDQAFFNLAPTMVKNLIKHTEPLPAPKRTPQIAGLDWKTMTFTIVFFSSLIFMAVVEILPLLARIETAYDNLCDGNTNFTYGLDPNYLVWMSDTNPWNTSLKEVAKYPHLKTIREAIYPQTVPKWKMQGVTVAADMGLRKMGRGVDAIAIVETYDVAESTEAVQRLMGTTCGEPFDFPGGVKRYTIEALAAQGLPNVTRCEDVLPFCVSHMNLARLACPVTCGCDNPTSNLALSQSMDGCPSACASTAWHQSTLRELPCTEKSAAQMRQDPVWKAYASQISARIYRVMDRHKSLLPELCATGGGECEEMFLALGCGVVPYYKETVLKMVGQMYDPCEGNFMGEALMTRPLSILCPITCRCPGAGLSAEALQARSCPGKCLNESASR